MRAICRKLTILFITAISLTLGGCLDDSQLDISSASNFGPQGLSVSAEEILEGGIAKVTVGLNYVTPRPVSFHIATVSDTAVGGFNYLDISQDLTIAAGQSQVTIPLVSLKRNQLRQDRYLKLVLSNSDGADIINAETTVKLKAPAFVGELKDITAIGIGDHNVCASQTGQNSFCWGGNLKRETGAVAAKRVLRNDLHLDEAAVKFSLNYQHGCALLASGKVYCWGASDYAQIAQQNVSNLLTQAPTAFFDSSKSAIDVAVGSYHTCVIFTNGTVGCKGYAGWGQLGGGNLTSTSFPYAFTMVVGLPAPAVSIKAGDESTCALLNTGAIYCWGENGQNELGDPTFATNAISNSARATVITSGATQIAAGITSYCALLATGVVRCWGANPNGELGVDTGGVSAPFPITVPLPATAVKIEAGWHSTCALLSTQEVYCWGRNDLGQLGDGTRINRPTPGKVIGLDGVPTTIATSGSISCAILTPGNRLQCWGGNYDYAVTASINYLTYPVDLPATVGQVVKDHIVTSGEPTFGSDSEQYGCAIMDNSETKCWGDNNYGQLGSPVVGGVIYRLPLASVTGLGAGLTSAIELGRQFACALMPDTGVKCFGRNNNDQIGKNTAITSPTVNPSSTPTGLTTGVTQLATTGQHACAVMSDKTVKCWGYTAVGQAGACGLGISRQYTPTAIAGITNAVSVAAAEDYSCAVLTDGSVKCWGLNTYGVFGNGLTTATCTVTPTATSISSVQKISLGNQHACALTKAGGVKCWGKNDYGQVGVTGLNFKYLPADVPGLESGVIDISAGQRHTCALLNTGAVKCWGADDYYQLGQNKMSVIANPTPIQPLGLGMNIKKIHAGLFNTCAITNEGMAKCWGSASSGIALEGVRYITFPVPVSNQEVTF